MVIDEKIHNIKDALENSDIYSIEQKKIIESILDILQDISCELEEINETIMY